MLRHRYSIVVWGYPPHEFAQTVLQMLQLLDEVTKTTMEWFWHPEPTIESIQPIPKSLEELEKLEGRVRDPDDGALDFITYSSNDLKFSISLDWPKVVRDFDVMVLGLLPEHLKGTNRLFDFAKLQALFVKLIRMFRPFWAAVDDLEYTAPEELRVKLDETQIPLQIHWFNYFGETIITNLGGKEKVLSAPVYLAEAWDEPPGIILKLQKEVFDYHNPAHRERVEAVERYFDLRSLQQQYLRRRR